MLAQKRQINVFAPLDDYDVNQCVLNYATADAIDTNVCNPGTSAQLFLLLIGLFGSNYTFPIAHRGTSEASFDVAVQKFAAGASDLSMALVSVTESRYKHVKFLPPVVFCENVWIISRTLLHPDYGTVHLVSFHFTTLFVMFCLVILFAILFADGTASRQPSRLLLRAVNLAFCTLKQEFDQQSSLHHKILYAFFMCYVILISSYYGATLTNHLQLSIRIPFRTFKELVTLMNTDRLRLVKEYSASRIELMRNSTNAQVRLAVKKALLTKTASEAEVEFLSMHKHVFPVCQHEAIRIIEKIGCENFIIVRTPDVGMTMKTFIIPRNSSYEETLSLYATMLQPHADLVTSAMADRCSWQSPDVQKVSLRWSHIATIFYVYLAGLVIGGAAFIAERRLLQR